MLEKGLIVSCQALKNEPLHSPFIMGRMALAAAISGAVAIRANGIEDIRAIRLNVKLPIIGLIKKNYDDTKVYITPKEEEVALLHQEGVEVIAVDATMDQNDSFLRGLKKDYPKQRFMADISTVEEGLRAMDLGFDYVSTTLVGYTERSEKHQNFSILYKLAQRQSVPVIAEGNFDQPSKAALAVKLGAYAVVVGSAITRPQCIAKQFNDAIWAVNE